MGQFFSPRNLLRIIWRRLPIILLVLIIGLPLAVFFALNQERQYEAIAAIQIEAPQVVQSANQAVITSASTSEVDLIQQQLGSRDHMIEVITRLGLFPEEDSMIEKVSMLRGAVEITKLIDPSQQFRPDATPSGLIINVRMSDPDEAALVANDFLDAILNEAAQRSEERAERTLAFFVAQEDRVAGQIGQVESELAAFKEANRGSLPTELTSQRDRLNTLQEQLLVLGQQVIELETSTDRLRGEDRDRQVALLAQQQALIQSNIDEVEADLARAPEVERNLSSLDRRLEQLETEFEAITTNKTEATIREQLESQDQAERYEVLERAVVPEYAVSTSRSKLAIAGGFVVGLLALAAAFAMEISRPVIRNAAQLEAQLGLQPVITVPHLSGSAMRRRQIAGVLAAVVAIIAIPMWFLFGLKDVILRLFGGSPAAS